MNLNQVKAKASEIKQCRDPAWWQAASLDEMEQARESLRDIVRYRDKNTTPDYDPPVIDIQDGHELREKQSTYLSSVDMQAYRVRVEKALQELFETDPVLIKIRHGESVSQHELDELNALVHTNHPEVDLNTLKNFYDTAAPMEQILRSIIGLDGELVNERFAHFVQAYPSLKARQVQFLGMLKRQIAQSGAIELDSLYEMPFASIGDPDNVFDDDQIDQLLEIVQSFGHQPKPSNNQHPEEGL